MHDLRRKHDASAYLALCIPWELQIGGRVTDVSEAGVRLLQMVLVTVTLALAALMPLASAPLHPRVVAAEG